MNEHSKQAKDFLKSTGTQLAMQEIRSELAFRPPWATEDEIQHGYEYRVALIRGSYPNDYKDYRFSFWGSIADAQQGKRPTAYDILACLDTYGADLSFDDFVAEMGYEIKGSGSYERIQAIYKSVQDEAKGLKNLFSEKELQELESIN